jgi:uncharacterized protein (DUF486 family)
MWQTGLITVLMLVVSNIFMTFAWYGHLKLQTAGISTHWPLFAVVLFSWGIALAENKVTLSPLLNPAINTLEIR